MLIAGAKKELAYLDRFGAPRAPYDRFRREYYDYKKQPPSDHIENLNRYLRLAPALVPPDDSLNAFCIRHPDLSANNIRVSAGPGGLRIVSILDWQHAVVLPLFLQGGMPEFIQNEEDEVSRKMVEPALPSDFDELSEEDRDQERELFRRRLVHFHYNLSTATYNKVHHKSLVYPFNPFRRRIVIHASAPWEGETIKLLYALIDLVLDWEQFATGGTPCPVVFTEEEIAAAEKLYQNVANAERSWRQLKQVVGCGEDTWVPAARYEVARAMSQELKQRTLEACADDEDLPKETYSVIEANWPLDDMDEEELEEYK